MNQRYYMRQALVLADQAAGQDEVPVGALVIRQDALLGSGYNQPISRSDPTAHAEINAIRDAGRYLDNYRLRDADLYVTLEPCLMCFMAMVHARIKTLIFGAEDPKNGFSRFLDASVRAQFNHQIEVISGVLADESAEKIQQFFREKRDRGKRPWIKQIN